MTEPTELANGRDAAGRLNEYRSELTALQSRSEKLAAEEAQLLPWESLTMPLECATTEKVLIQMGTLPAAVLPQQIHETLDAAGDLYELREVSADREHRYMVLTVHISQAEDHIAALKALGWSRVTLGERTGTAAANLSALRQEQTELAEKRALLEEAIIQCAGQNRSCGSFRMLPASRSTGERPRAVRGIQQRHFCWRGGSLQRTQRNWKCCWRAAPARGR